MIELITVDQGENKGTMGVIIVNNVACCWSLELPWLNNIPFISCVPSGEYSIVLEYSPKFNMNLYELKGVPGRSECKFHIANSLYEIKGCIALGTIPMIKQGKYELEQSTKAFDKFMLMMKGVKEDTLIISGRP